LLCEGFNNLRCFVRPSGELRKLEGLRKVFGKASIEVVKGNLLSPDDCKRAVKDVSVIFHVAAGIEKTFPGCFMNSVVTTRNLLHSIWKRVLNGSSTLACGIFEC
jgi:hypothetical protein